MLENMREVGILNEAIVEIMSHSKPGDILIYDTQNNIFTVINIKALGITDK